MDNTALPVTASSNSVGIGVTAVFEDFLPFVLHDHSPLSMQVTSINGGTGALETGAPADNSYMGRVDINTGITNNATGKSVCEGGGGDNRIKAGGNPLTIAWRIRIPVLSGTPQFNIKIGLQDGTAIGDPANGIYLYYSSTINSGNWRCVSRNASTSSIVDSSSTVVANTWYTLSFQVNAAGNFVEFFVNNISIGSVSTNIPTTNGMRCMASIEKQGTASIVSRTLSIDSVYVRSEK